MKGKTRIIVDYACLLLISDHVHVDQVECALLLNAGVQLKERDREENMEEQYAALATLRLVFSVFVMRKKILNTKIFFFQAMVTTNRQPNPQVPPCHRGRGRNCSACSRSDGCRQAGHRPGGGVRQQDDDQGEHL